MLETVARGADAFTLRQGVYLAGRAYELTYIKMAANGRHFSKLHDCRVLATRAKSLQKGFRAMTITLYGIKNCDTMKKARSWLDAHEVQYTFHDYKAAGIDPAVLAHWCSEVGWETLLNRAGTTFRKLPENQKQNMNERKAMTLMAAQPSMIKRPVLEYGKRLLVGFTPEVYEQVVRGQV